MTLARLLRWGNSAKSWNTRPMPRRSGGTNVEGPATSRLSMSTRPESGRSMPEAILRRVVLPQPEGPSRQSTSPGATTSEMPASARTDP
jgi:hypothetical protein